MRAAGTTIGVAMALAQATPLLLLDEPTTFLDIARQMEVLDLCARLHEEGRTLVAVLPASARSPRSKKAPVYRELRVRKQGRDVLIRADDRVYEATSFPSVLSMPVLLEELVPRLAAAADGDPATSTDQQPA